MPNDNERPWERGGRDDDYEDDDRPRRRDEYDDRPARPKSGSNGLAIAGLILGVLGFVTCGMTALPGLICSAIALGKPSGRGLAIGGVVASLLSGLIGVAIGVGLLLPAVQKVREAAARMKDSNNMKMLAIGEHSAASRHDDTMSMYARDNAGKVQPGLSFRVELLQYVEQDSLYRQFDMTQPWDSAKNRPLSNTPVKWYNSPYENGETASTQTPYRALYGGGAAFDEKGTVNLRSGFTDGTSNTILIVHATEQVPWAEPRELKYDPNGPLPKFGQPNARGFNVALADGSVRFITPAVSERTLRAAITARGGEVLGADW